MIRSIERQRGLGWFGLLFLFGTIAFFAIIAVKVGPIFMNHGTVSRVVSTVANQSSPNDAAAIRRTLESRWAIDYIDHLDHRDVKIRNTPKGKALVYEYAPEVNLFYNVFVVVKFKGEHLLKGNSS